MTTWRLDEALDPRAVGITGTADDDWEQEAWETDEAPEWAEEDDWDEDEDEGDDDYDEDEDVD